MKILKNLDAIKLDNWVYQTAEVNGVNGITEDKYRNGETAEKIAAREAFATAMIVEDGEIVKAGNGIYKVRVASGANGRFARYSNPISFVAQ